MTSPRDYDLPGVVGVRVLDAGASELEAIDRQLGPLGSTLNHEPDLTLRFVDRIQPKGTLRTLGKDDAGFDDESFYILRGAFKSRVMVEIPFAELGQPCEVRIEKGLSAVPLLVALINFQALQHGVLPLHSSAFELDGTCTLVTGWSKGGKTEALLASMAHGANYVGDEWVYVHPDTKRLCGLPQPIRVWKWHLDSLPAVQSSVRFKERARVSVLHSLSRGVEGSRRVSPVGRSFLRRLSWLLGKQTHIDLAPHQLFGADACRLEGRLDRLVFVCCHESPEIRWQREDPAQIAERMLASQVTEAQPLLQAYQLFRHAFPGAVNPRIEKLEQRQRELLEESFHSVPSFGIYHPYRMDLRELHTTLQALPPERSHSAGHPDSAQSSPRESCSP